MFLPPVDEWERMNVFLSRVTAGKWTFTDTLNREDRYLFQRQLGLGLFTDIVSDVSKGCSRPQPGLGGCSSGHGHALCACYSDLRLIFGINFRVLKEARQLESWPRQVTVSRGLRGAQREALRTEVG